VIDFDKCGWLVRKIGDEPYKCYPMPGDVKPRCLPFSYGVSAIAPSRSDALEMIEDMLRARRRLVESA
jgi:hypothetical protein